MCSSDLSPKWDFQLRFIAAIAYLSLCNNDSTFLYPFGADLVRTAPRSHHLSDYPLIIKFLQDLTFSSHADFEKSIDQFIAQERRRGIIFIVSDCFYELDSFDRVLRKLRWHKFDTTLIQILAEEEINPTFLGSSRLIDSETNKFLEMDMSLGYRDYYQEVCEKHTRDLRVLCSKYGFQFACAQSHLQTTGFIMNLLRKGSKL